MSHVLDELKRRALGAPAQLKQRLLDVRLLYLLWSMSWMAWRHIVRVGWTVDDEIVLRLRFEEMQKGEKRGSHRE